MVPRELASIRGSALKIAAVVSGRADDAPMGPVIAELAALNANVVKLDMSERLLDDSPHSCVRALTDGMEFVARQLEDIRPDLVLLLGDRYETLGAAQVAHIFGIPIAHIHGGETTEGSFDNEFRHAITCLAHRHFVVHDEAAVRVFDIVHGRHYGAGGGDGLLPTNIHIVGAPGLDNIVDLPPQEFERPYFLVTYHPVTKGETRGHTAIVKALESFPNYGVIWTGVNNDPGRDAVQATFFNVGKMWAGMDNLSPKRYLSAMKYAACCIGNSSSFLIEAPALGVPTVNVGDRQKGRLRGHSVMDAVDDAKDIESKIRLAFKYRGITPSGPFTNPYGSPGASKRIAEMLTCIVEDRI